jgi:hypothetical protein
VVVSNLGRSGSICGVVQCVLGGGCWGFGGRAEPSTALPFPFGSVAGIAGALWSFVGGPQGLQVGAVPGCGR